MKMKRVLLIVMAFTLFFATAVPDMADARRGGFKSGTRSFTTTPKKSTTDNVKRSDSGTAGSTVGKNSGRGFFSGGGFMRSMMIGGIAGFLFGSMFAGMGAFGQILGFMVNALFILLIVVLIMNLIRRFTSRRNYDRHRRGES